MGSFEVHFSWSQEQADFQAIWASFTEVLEEENGFHLQTFLWKSVEIFQE